MDNLILAILSSAAIYVVFKAAERYGKDSFVLICYNYMAAFLLSLFSLKEGELRLPDINFISNSAIIGVLFISVFFIISLSSKYAGVAKTTLASKMSFVIPVLFSILFYGESLYAVKIAGLILAFVAVVMAVYRKGGRKFDIKGVLFPVVLFVGAGVVDSSVKYMQEGFLRNGGENLFSSVLFGTSFLISLIALSLGGSIRRLFVLNRVFWGVMLGAANYGSLYFLIKALNDNLFSSSVIYAVINTGIVVLNLFIGIYFFKEKISLLNKVGIAFALISIMILMLV